MSLTPVDRAPELLARRRPTRRAAQPRRHRRPGGRRADREGDRGQDPRRAGGGVARPRPGAARQAHWVPNWYKAAYSSPTGTCSAGPDEKPPYARGDADLVVRPGEVRQAEGALTDELPPDGRLSPPPPAADRPDAVRHPAHQLRAGAVHARRADRAGSSPATARDRRSSSTASAAEARSSGEPSRRRRGRAERRYRGAQGLPPEFIAELEKQFGFDKPPWQRFLLMLGTT